MFSKVLQVVLFIVVVVLLLVKVLAKYNKFATKAFI